MLRIVTLVALVLSLQPGQVPKQPKVFPGPSEPDWLAILDGFYGLSMFGDLANPVKEGGVEATPGRFRRVGPGPVAFTPVFALGLETPNRGGWYRPGDGPGRPNKVELWSYQFKHTSSDLEKGTNLPLALNPGGSTTFDPGAGPFGLWVSNDALNDGGVFSDPREVAAINSRLARQPYKAMIYPLRDKATGELVPQSYLIGWEYSTNDDFQDVVCRIDNVELVE